MSSLSSLLSLFFASVAAAGLVYGVMTEDSLFAVINAFSLTMNFGFWLKDE